MCPLDCITDSLLWGGKGCRWFLLIKGQSLINSLRPRQNGRHFADDNLKYIFLNENVWILIKISLKFVHKGPIDYIPVLVQKMAWRRSGDKSLSELMLVILPTHICVSRLQWVNAKLYVSWVGSRTSCSKINKWTVAFPVKGERHHDPHVTALQCHPVSNVRVTLLEKCDYSEIMYFQRSIYSAQFRRFYARPLSYHA